MNQKLNLFLKQILLKMLPNSQNLPKLPEPWKQLRGPGDAVLQSYPSRVGSPSDISEIEALNVEIKEAHVTIVPDLMHTFLDGMQRIGVSIANVDRNILPWILPICVIIPHVKIVSRKWLNEVWHSMLLCSRGNGDTSSLNNWSTTHAHGSNNSKSYCYMTFWGHSHQQ